MPTVSGRSLLVAVEATVNRLTIANPSRSLETDMVNPFTIRGAALGATTARPTGTGNSAVS